MRKGEEEEGEEEEGRDAEEVSGLRAGKALPPNNQKDAPFGTSSRFGHADSRHANSRLA